MIDVRPPGADSADHRRAHPRYLLNLAGTADVAGRQYPCELRDFGVGGMLLVFPAGHAGTITAGSETSVACVLPDGQALRHIRFLGRVVRASEYSAGITFIDPEPDNLRAMLRFATNRPPVSPNAAHKALFQLDAVTARSLLERCNQMALASLEPLLRSTFSTLSRRLFDFARNTRLVVEQDACFLAMEQLHKSEDRLLDAFQAAVTNRFRSSALTRHPVRVSTADFGQRTLSLVDDASLENWLAVNDVATKVQDRHKEQLAGLERRLSVVSGVHVGSANNPYGPQVISESFQEVIAGLQWTQPVSKLTYTTFRDVLAEHADAFYEKLNRFLAEQGILPKLKTYELANRPACAPGAPIAYVLEDGDASESSVKSVRLDAQQMVSPESNVLRPSPKSVGRPDFYQVVRELRELSKGTTQHHLGHREPRSRQAPPASPADNTYAKSELLAALAQLQAQQAEGDEPRDSQDLRGRLLQALSQRGGADSPKHVSDYDDTIIDVAGNLFKAMLQDPMVAHSVKHWLKRLELPLMRLALQDGTLFLDKSHVARQVVNRIAQLEVYGPSGVTGKNSIHMTVDGLIEKVVKESSGDTEVFKQALQRLDHLVGIQHKAYTKNLRDVVNSCQTRPPVAEPLSVAVDCDQEERDRWIGWARRLRRGDWLLLQIQGEETKRVQIAWASEAQEVFVLVNLLGHLERTLDIDTMARLLCTGAAVPMAEAADPALDRAQYVMLQGLHDQLLYQSTHDSLTGLINRDECDVLLRRALADAKRTDSRHVLCFIDIDKFSAINTACGHGAGDQLLKAVAALIKEQSSGKGILARLGSDEFGLLLEDCSLDDALDLAEKQVQAADEFRFEWEDKRMPIGLSIGIVPLNARSDSVTDIWRAAESSCRLARDLGGHRLQVYHAGHARLSHQDMMMKWIGKIDQMLDRDQLFLRCQRIVRIDDSGLERPHFEILLGVRDGMGQVHAPQHFIEAAEWYQRMPAIDRWVARHALDWMSRNDARVQQVEGFSINLSGQSVTDEGFADFLIGELDRTQVPRDKVYFEVTETVGISNLGDAVAFIEKVKKAGCKFSLDDFGSGMSSYGYLKNLPVDVVKIDGAFVKNMDVNSSDYAVVKSVCEIAHFMEKKVVAEFVESQAVFELLREIGVDYAQGYFIEKPVTLDDLIVG